MTANWNATNIDEWAVEQIKDFISSLEELVERMEEEEAIHGGELNGFRV